MAINLKTLLSVLKTNYECGINTYITGKPGIGKTQTIERFARLMKKKNKKFEFHSFYGSTLSPMDIQAAAPDFKTQKLVMFNSETLPNGYTHPDAEGIVFFGELPNTDPLTAKLLQKYVNGEDMNGSLIKPKNIHIVADGNRLSDRSGAQQQSLAFLSRFMHVEIEQSANDNLQYATKKKWHPDILIFLDRNPEFIDNYDPQHAQSGVWANMRSWERVSKLQYKHKITLPLYYLEGNVGLAVALQYIEFQTLLKDLPPLKVIMKNPTTVEIPQEISRLFAFVSMVATRATESTLKPTLQLTQRLTQEMQVYMLRKLLLNPNTKEAVHQEPLLQEFLDSSDIQQALGI